LGDGINPQLVILQEKQNFTALAVQIYQLINLAAPEAVGYLPRKEISTGSFFFYIITTTISLFLLLRNPRSMIWAGMMI